MLQKFVIFLFIIIPLLLVVALFSFEIKSVWVKKNYKKIVYKKLHNYSEESDQLLSNDVHLVLSNDGTVSYIDHIFIADKYIYVVKDVYFDGMLYGNISDPILINYTNKGKKVNVNNPLFENSRVVNDLMEKIDSTKKDNTIVNVVCYNNDLILPEKMKVKKQGIFFVSSNDLIPTIKIAEKDQIVPIAHQKSERLINLLKEASDKVKAEEKGLYVAKRTKSN